MGSGVWFKAVVSLKKVKLKFTRSKKGKGSKALTWKDHPGKMSGGILSSSKNGNSGMPVEDMAATRIQSAFRAYRARKTLRRLKGRGRLQTLTQQYPVKKQAMTTLNYLHSWSKIQTQIQNRRLCMVTEGRIRQKKLENQLKLESKIHDLEVEWSGGAETMEETLARIHQREEASVKRERALAYAFSHQWRANSSQYHGLGNYEFSKANWGWSWKERWIAACPWESRAPAKSISLNKTPNKQANKIGKNTNSPTPKTSVSTKTPLANSNGSVLVKTPSSNGKGAIKARRLSFPAVEKASTQEESTVAASEANTKNGELVS